jgi:hypothetical protein
VANNRPVLLLSVFCFALMADKLFQWETLLYWTKSENVLFYSENHNAANVVFTCTTHELDLIRFDGTHFFLFARNPLIPGQQHCLFHNAQVAGCIYHVLLSDTHCSYMPRARLHESAHFGVREWIAVHRRHTHTRRSKVVQQLLNLAGNGLCEWRRQEPPRR